MAVDTQEPTQSPQDLEKVVDDLVARTGGSLHRTDLRRAVHREYARIADGATVTGFLPILTERAVLAQIEAGALDDLLTHELPKVVVVDAHNSTRSQCAAALIRYYAPGRYSVSSAGFSPTSYVNPVVGEVLGEIGLSLTDEPQTVTPAMVAEAAHVIAIADTDSDAAHPALEAAAGKLEVWIVPAPDHGDRADLEGALANVDARVRNFLLTLEPDHALTDPLLADGRDA